MNHETTKRSVAVTAVLLVAAAVLWVAVVAVLVFVVPGYDRAFRDQAVQLPTPTQWAVAAGRWAVEYWYVLPLLGLRCICRRRSAAPCRPRSAALWLRFTWSLSH
jgi:type II secretory pathway component PulF